MNTQQVYKAFEAGVKGKCQYFISACSTHHRPLLIILLPRYMGRSPLSFQTCKKQTDKCSRASGNRQKKVFK
jgi:hypothetical protein